MPSVLLYYASIGVFLWHAARNPRADIRVLGASLLLPALVSFHDLALYLELIPGDTYIGALTSPLGLIGISFAVAWRFSEAMRRAEGFNVELRHEFAAATAQPGDTMAREHA